MAPGRFPTETWEMSLEDAHSYTVSLLRLGRGMMALHDPDPSPRQPLELYDFEGCPYCRKVREVLTELDLEYVCRPCGKGSNNRQFVEAEGGKQQFPFLVDPNRDVTMYESEDIIDYLAETYGPGRWRFWRLVSPLNTLGSAITTAVRPRGISVREGFEERSQPDELLELYNFEASPFCRKVREVLCELNLDSRVHNVGKGSSRRPDLIKRGGKMQVPYLIDPNTGSEMYESDDIVHYLERRYG